MLCKLKQNFFIAFVKLIEYFFFAVEVCSNPFVRPFLGTNMSFFVLLIRAEKLISNPKINTSWPNPTPGNEKRDPLSNPVP